ncbi:hypothetical protein [Paenibacillus tuaregi]|uniref:hypothetical protein n=1 Tax=Paenibacillus tuaregi TaxID=1816681 RepID=UPI000839641A|nr:hypothetical protein [Paenibacillus tuaregi]
MYKTFCLFLLLFFSFLVSCTNNKEPNLEHTTPNGPTIALTVAVLGNSKYPAIPRVSYVNVGFNDLNQKNSRTFDGLIVSKEYFEEAAQPMNKEFLKHIKYPVFFIGAEEISTAAFYVDGLALDQIKGDDTYASGFVRTEQGEYKTWGLGLPNEPTDTDKGLNILVRICNILQEYKISKKP